MIIQKLKIRNSETIKRKIRILNERNVNLIDEDIDTLLGMPNVLRETSFNLMKEKYGNEQFVYEPTPYNYIRYFLKKLQPRSNEIIYDLGSGLGRIIIYGAINFPAKFIGIEIVKERTDAAIKIKDNLKLENAYIENSNCLDEYFRNGDIFFLFNPFKVDTLKKIILELKEIARFKKIRIVTWGGISNLYFSSQNWLKEIKYNDNPYPVQFFESV